VLRDDAACCRFGGRLTREAQHATTVLQANKDLTAIAPHRRHFAPRDADVKRAAECQPAACEYELAGLVGAPAAEPHSGNKVTRYARRGRVGRLRDGRVAAREARLEFECIRAGANRGKIVGDLVVAKPELPGSEYQAFKGGRRRRIADRMQFVPELGQPANQFLAGAFGFAWKGHGEYQV
jgi:hypothetical protein